MDKVTVHHSTAYDFLAGMYRLNNNEKLVELISELDTADKIKFNDEILKWVENSRRKFTKEIKERLDLFFNYESFFGVCLINDIASKDINNAKAFIRYVEQLPLAYILKSFLGTGYGPEDITEEQTEKMLGNHKDAIAFIEKNISLPSQQKWELLQFFLDPEGMKDKLLELFRWYYENIFSSEEEKLDETVRKYEKELKKKLETYGEEYLKLLVDTDYSKSKGVEKIFISSSYYCEISSMKSSREDTGVDLYILGYRYPEVIAEGRHTLLTNVNMFKALADETRLNIIKLLSERPWYGNELAQKLKLSNSTISYHMSMLIVNGFVESSREDNRYYFSMDINKVKKILCDALDKMVE
ncbi:MAG: ArsR/SmtB family transcription factor [Caulobacteraceae bacterium]